MIWNVFMKSSLLWSSSVTVVHSYIRQQRCKDAAFCVAGEMLLFSVWTLGGKLSVWFPCYIMWGDSMNEAVGSWRRGVRWVKGWEGKVTIIWYSFSGSLHHAHTLTHPVSPFHLFSCYHFSPWGSRCQFLPRLIIALLASPCNGPILSNPEHWACALPMTKDYFIDPSFSPLPSLCLLVSFLHFFMPSSNFLTVILYCFLPPGSHDPMQRKAGPRWVILSLSVVDAPLFLQHGWLNLLKISAFVKW